MNFGKVFATFFQKVVAVKNAIVKDEPKVAAVLQKAEGTEGTVEAVTAAIPTYGPLAVTFEKALYMAMGELSKVLAVGSDAAVRNFTDAGMDIAVIQTIQDVYQTEAHQIAALAKVSA